MSLANTVRVLNSDVESGSSLAGAAVFANAFRPGGTLDLQRNYNGATGDNIPAFRDAASFMYGVYGNIAGYSLDDLMLGGGAVNYLQYLVGNVQDIGGAYNNSQRNVNSMTAGYTAQTARE
jgi:hypothetical protein